jgi:hypothetical protein
VRERKKRGKREKEERKNRERLVRYGGRRERLDPRDLLPANQKAPLKMPQMCICLETSSAVGCAFRLTLTRSTL